MVSPDLRRQLDELDLLLRDNPQARELQSDGSYPGSLPGESR